MVDCLSPWLSDATGSDATGSDATGSDDELRELDETASVSGMPAFVGELDDAFGSREAFGGLSQAC